MKHSSQAFFYTACCIVLWSLIPIVARLGQTDLDNYQFLFWSSLLSFFIIGLCTIASGKAPILRTYSLKDIAVCFGLGFMGAFLYYILLYYGYAHAQGLEVLVLQYMWPILIVLFSWIILREKIYIRTFLSLIFGFAGVVCVLTKGNIGSITLDNFFIDSIVLLAASVFALFSVLSKKVKYEALIATTLFFASATVFSFFSMILFSEYGMPDSTKSWMIVLLNGVFVNGLSYVLWLLALSKGKASTIAPLVFLTPALAAILIVGIFDEPFYGAYAIGLVLVIAGGLLTMRSKRSV